VIIDTVLEKKRPAAGRKSERLQSEKNFLVCRGGAVLPVGAMGKGKSATAADSKRKERQNQEIKSGCRRCTEGWCLAPLYPDR